MRTLEEIFKQNAGRRIQRHDHVLKIYDEFFARFRGENVNVLEIGLGDGGSLQMWKEYFGPNAKIYGVDIAAVAHDEGIRVFMGDQGDKDFMKSVAREAGGFDIIIDDASHESGRTIASFEALIGSLRHNGIYAVEDLHTSYRETYGGGYGRPYSIVEYLKDFIDFFHEADLPEGMEIPSFLKHIHGVHFFRNVAIIEKNINAYRAGSPLMTGEGTIRDSNHDIMGSRFEKLVPAE